MVYRQFEKFTTKRFKRVMQDRLNQYIIMTLGIFMVIIGYGYIRIGLPKVHQLHVSGIWTVRSYISNCYYSYHWFVINILYVND